MIRWTGLAPWEFEFPFPGSLTSTFLGGGRARKWADLGFLAGAREGVRDRKEVLPSWHAQGQPRLRPEPTATVDVKRFRGGLVVKAHRLVYHSTPGLRVIKKNKKFIDYMTSMTTY